MRKVTKALIPAAGLGTRFLPASKTVPKEMFPIVDKPGLLYTIEEAMAAGITDIILVQGRGKGAMEDFFDKSFELEETLSTRGKSEFLKTLDTVRNNINLISIRQKEALGLGHAVHCGKPIVGNEPFAVLLPDELMVGTPNVTEELVESFNTSGKSTVAIMEVPKTDVSKYGIADVTSESNNLYKINDLIEKPDIQSAPSRWALPGRYVFESDIFEEIEKTGKGTGGEIQLTDAMVSLAKMGRLNGLTFQARRFDTGNKYGFLQANIELGMESDEIGPQVRELIKNLAAQI